MHESAVRPEDTMGAVDTPVCPFAHTMCRTVFPPPSRMSDSGSAPNLSTNCWISSRSPYRHDRSSSSLSSSVGDDMAVKMMVRIKVQLERQKVPVAREQHEGRSLPRSIHSTFRTCPSLPACVPGVMPLALRFASVSSRDAQRVRECARSAAPCIYRARAAMS